MQRQLVNIAARLDAAIPQRPVPRGAVVVWQQDQILEIIVRGLVGRLYQLYVGVTGEFGIIDRRQFAPPFQKQVDGGELPQPHQRSHLRQAPIVAHRCVVINVDVLWHLAELAQRFHFLGEGWVIGGDHATLAGRQNFGREEAEASGYPKSSCLDSVQLRAMRLRRIFDQMQPALVADTLQLQSAG